MKSALIIIGGLLVGPLVVKVGTVADTSPGVFWQGYPMVIILLGMLAGAAISLISGICALSFKTDLLALMAYLTSAAIVLKGSTLWAPSLSFYSETLAETFALREAGHITILGGLVLNGASAALGSMGMVFFIIIPKRR